MTDSKPEIHEIQKALSMISTKQYLSLSYSNCRKPKSKRKSWKKLEKENHLTYKGTRVRIWEEFSSETKQARKE